MIRTMAHMLARRWHAWLAFEVLFQLLRLALVASGLKLSLDGAMQLAGFTYLTWENLLSFALSPTTLVVALAWVIILVLFSIIELAGTHYILALDDKEGYPQVHDALLFAVTRATTVVRPANLLLPFYLLVLLPFVQMGSFAGVASSFNLPEFIMEYVIMNPLYSVLYAVLLATLTLLMFRFVFTVVFFVSEDMTFRQAAAKAFQAGKGHFVADMLRLIFVPLLFDIAIHLVLFVVSQVATLISGDAALASGLSSLASMLTVLLTATPLAYAACLALLQTREVQPTAPKRPALGKTPVWAGPVAVGALAAVAIAGLGFFAWLNIIEPLRVVGQTRPHTVDLTAHRGGTFGAPENTMAAFAQAKADGADICELDVQQSADGVIFVSHDSNFRRISGVDKNVWEAPWSEVQQMDATGAFWANRAEAQGYPLLDDAITWAEENDMRLNIELKPTGHEVDFEKAVADIVNAHDFGGRCIVTSQAYDTVARMKEYAPEATCTYVMTLAYGNICELEAADAFSIEAASISPSLVAYLHAHGKPVLTWVVNSEANMNRVIGNGVDNVITDDVPLGRRVINAANNLSPESHLLYSLISVFA